MSSHKEVREVLKDMPFVFGICPNLNLKDAWIKRLQERFDYTGLDKDKRALGYAKQKYEEDIKDIINSLNKVLTIDSIDYDLNDIVNVAISLTRRN